MKYEDFPILNNNQYKFISEQYLTLKTFNRNEIINSIASELIDLYTSIEKIENLNKKTTTQIENIRSVVLKLHNNLTNLLNIKTKPATQVNKFNIFTFINKIIKTISSFETWQQNEEKEYYKLLAHKSILELLNSLNNLLKELSESNVVFFKFM